VRTVTEVAESGEGTESEAALVEEVDGLLRSVPLLVRQRGRQSLAGLEVTPPQFNALMDIARSGPLTMGDLCQHLYLASSTVTDLVDRMERAGLVERERDAVDRRVIRLHLTERGRAVIDQVMAARSAYLREVLRRMSAEDRRAVVRALRLIERQMLEVHER